MYRSRPLRDALTRASRRGRRTYITEADVQSARNYCLKQLQFVKPQQSWPFMASCTYAIDII